MEAAFFDLDGTIVNLPTEKVFCRELYRDGVVSSLDMLKVALVYLKYELGLVSGYADAKRYLIRTIVQDLAAPEIAARAARFLDEQVKPNISREAVAEIAAHHTVGRTVYIVSSTLDCLVDPIVDFLGTGERLATRLEIRDARYTGKVVGEIVYGPQKALLVKEIASSRSIDLTKSYAYGDSIQDADMLRCVGNPRVVNPDRRMARVAKQSGWQIMTWK